LNSSSNESWPTKKSPLGRLALSRRLFSLGNWHPHCLPVAIDVGLTLTVHVARLSSTPSYRLMRDHKAICPGKSGGHGKCPHNDVFHLMSVLAAH
jgi:hypothetical protein